MTADLAELARRLRFFVGQDLAQRFKGNTLGVLWAALLPLLQFALFALLFVAIFRARVPGLDEQGYLAFLSLGMWPWFAFAEATTRSIGALSESAGLLRKVAVEPWLLVAARVVSAFVLQGAGLVLVIVALTLLGVDLHWGRLPIVVLAWLALLPLAFAIGLLLGLLQVFVRDLQQVAPYLINALMFLSPILYAASMLPAWAQDWMHWNPVALSVSGVRDSLMFGSAPVMAWPALVSVLASLLLAAWVYRRLRPQVIDFL